MPLQFAFLVLKEHPYGREMLRCMLEHGHVPIVVIEEASPLADGERAKFLGRIAGQPQPPRIASLLDGRAIPHLEVANHNNEACAELVRQFDPDLIVLGGTRIIRSSLLTLAPRGMINAHPGLLPWLRGSSSVAWALYKDLPVGSTVHFVDEGIDSGPIIAQKRLSVCRGDTYEAIVRRMLSLSGELMVEALGLLATGEAAVAEQDPSAGETLRVIPPELAEAAKERLAAGTYSHFEDQEQPHVQSAV